ncbi:MAG: hypothetical protein WKF30_13940 [Pyrinomonadaceae bacterium]
MISLAARSTAPKCAADGRHTIVHLIETLGSGGAERLLYTNLKHLPAPRFKSIVITVFDTPGRWTGPIRELGVEVESLGCRDYQGLARGVVRLRAWLNQERPNLCTRTFGRQTSSGAWRAV